MFQILKARWIQGYRTGAFPDAPPTLPELFQGRPRIDGAACAAECRKCVELCPADAIAKEDGKLRMDLGKCIFCGKCSAGCPSKAIGFSKEHALGAFSRDVLECVPGENYVPEAQKDETFRRFCGKSLKIRQVSAGGCAACELDFNVLNTLAWDMGRFGIKAVASPRHADCLLVTGPVTENMLLGLRKTYAALPRPAWVIACGACAISGGIYAQSPVAHGGLEEILKPDLYVPGCPPHPATLLEALLRLMGR